MVILFKELNLLSRYFLVTFSLLSFWCLKKFPTILVFFFYPVGKIFKKKLIILQALELINSSFFLTLHISAFCLLPFAFCLFKIFFSSSWYSFQIKLFSNFLYLNFLYLNFSFLFSYCLFFLILNLSLLWNFETFNSFHLFEIQFQVFRFVEFQITNLNFSISIFSIFSIFSITVRWFFSWTSLFFIFRKIRFFFFFFIVCFFLLFYIDITFQFFLLLNMGFFFLEFIFFYICWKLQ
uniref:Sec-independent protein translocase component TatC n=1 Tax=Symphyocladiella dendroidea TaxID=2506487 RepID=UPI0022FD8AD6|nr:Sec-independent protein translocase component TatC [Symphyocladiella dendroidea]WAX04038.1 Sec-independent protein translocase component TatC [Symphyocladiella dendroidea]